MGRLLPVAATALGVVAVTLLAAALAPLVDRDEPRYALAVREMQDSGDLLVPRNLGRLRADKPPLLYWCQLAAVDALGETEVALRLPSILAAGMLVFLTAGVARRLGADAVIAGSIAVPGLVVAGALATPDALVVMLGTLSLWAFLRAADGADGWPSAALGWVAMGAAILVKGPVAPLFVGSALIGLWRAERGALRRLGWWWGPLVAGALVASWFIPANLATNWEIARLGLGRHVLGRALHPLEHHGLGGVPGLLLGPPFYIASLLVVAFPIALAPLAVWRRRSTLPPRLVSVTSWGVLAPLLVLCVVATKLPHYVVPALPLVAVSAAATRAPRRVAGWIATVVLLVTGVVAARSTPWRAAGRAVAAQGGAVTIGLAEPSLTWAARDALAVVDEDALLDRAAAKPVVALLRRDTVARLAAAHPELEVATLGRWGGLNLAKGRHEDIRLVRIVATSPVKVRAPAPRPALAGAPGGPIR